MNKDNIKESIIFFVLAIIGIVACIHCVIYFHKYKQFINESAKTINTEECSIVRKMQDDERGFYFVEAEDEAGNVIRFQTNKDYYEQVQISEPITITEKTTDYPIFPIGTKLNYYVGDEKLSNPFVIHTEKSDVYISPYVGKYAQLVSETVIPFEITDFEEEITYHPIVAGRVVTTTRKTRHYIFLENKKEKIQIRLDSYNNSLTELWNTRVAGDTIDILVQEIDTLLEGKTYRYSYNGTILEDAAISYTK